ncbi:wax ester synthase-like acyl-CoA acyltransferase domain-containing protein [Gongronella butleri]|nr:wax ester synthase-like acyl-CoA acyltransferase domain-containing protein [Gongronella butleri]
MTSAQILLSRELGQHLSGMENLFFQIEHPSRLMTICSLWEFQRQLDMTLVTKALADLCSQHPRFALVPKYGTPLETPIWCRPPQNWSYKDHIVVHTLAKPTLACLQDYMANQYAIPFAPNQPLWQLHYITGLAGGRTAILWKAHHSLSDGIGCMLSVFSSTTSFNHEAQLNQFHQRLQQSRQKAAAAQERQKAAAAATAASTQDHGDHQSIFMVALGGLWSFFVFLVSWVVSVGEWMRRVADQVIHDLSDVAVLVMPLLFRRTGAHALMYDGAQPTSKRIAWTPDMSFSDVRAIQHAFSLRKPPHEATGWERVWRSFARRVSSPRHRQHCTLNDIMVLVFCRAFRKYLQQYHADTSLLSKVRIVVPLSFRHPLDASMANKVTGDMVEIDITDNCSNHAFLHFIHRRMMTIKRSILPYIVYHVITQRILRYFPFLVPPRFWQNMYTNLPHAIITNISGPQERITFAGEPIERFCALPPQPGKSSISVGLVSYGGDKINVAMLTDDHPEYKDLAHRLCDLFYSEFNALVAEASKIS